MIMPVELGLCVSVVVDTNLTPPIDDNSMGQDEEREQGDTSLTDLNR